MSITSLNQILAIQCKVRKRYRNASIIDVNSLFNQSNFEYGTHHLDLFNQTDSSWVVRKRTRFVMLVGLRQFVQPQTKMSLRLSGASAIESSQKLQHGREAGGVL